MQWQSTIYYVPGLDFSPSSKLKNFHQSLAGLLLIFHSNSSLYDSPGSSLGGGKAFMVAFIFRVIWTLNDGYLIIRFVFISSSLSPPSLRDFFRIQTLLWFCISPGNLFRNSTFVDPLSSLISVFVLISSSLLFFSYPRIHKSNIHKLNICFRFSLSFLFFPNRRDSREENQMLGFGEVVNWTWA